MDAQHLWINLRYHREDLRAILRYARHRGVDFGGRCDFDLPPRLNIWTHSWLNPSCKAESTLMFTIEVDWNTPSLLSVLMQPGYNQAIFLDELARLETAALGHVVWGKSRSFDARQA